MTRETRRVATPRSRSLAFAVWLASFSWAQALFGNPPDKVPFGAFGGDGHSPLVLVTEGALQGTIAVTVYASTPKTARDAPVCVTAEVAGDGARFECFTPLRSCAREIELASQGSGLSLRVGQASGAECREPWGNAKLTLARADFPAMMAGLYVGSEPASSAIWNAFRSRDGAEAAAAPTREVIAAYLRERYGAERVTPLRSAERQLYSPYHDLLKGCGHPGTTRCPLEKARALVKSIAAKDAKLASTAATKRGTRKAPNPGWFGTWAGALGVNGADTVELERSRDGRGWLEFDGLRASGNASCVGHVPAGASSAEVSCRSCGRVLAFRIDRGRMIVRLLGDSWRTRCHAGYWSDEGTYVFTLTRLDAFSAFVPRYVRASANSDLGSSGGQVFYHSLGADKEATVKNFGRIIAGAYRAAGRDPAELSVSTLSKLVGELHFWELARCRKLPGLPNPVCDPTPVDAKAKEIVLGWLKQRGMLAVQ